MRVEIIISPDEPDYVAFSSDEGYSWASSNGVEDRYLPLPDSRMLVTASEMLVRYAIRHASRLEVPDDEG